MELIQRKGRYHDSLELDGRRIRHRWSLKKENGEHSTDLANLDPDFAVTTRKSEGKLPYFVLGFIFLFLISIHYPPGEGTLETVVRYLLWAACACAFAAGFLLRRKVDLTILHLKDGAVFAVIRHHWVNREAREEFLPVLKDRIKAAQK